MSKFRIKGEEIFKVPISRFCISPSAEKYTLNFSADGIDFTPYAEATAAGLNEIIVNAPANMYIKLVGNKSELTIVF